MNEIHMQPMCTSPHITRCDESFSLSVYKNNKCTFMYILSSMNNRSTLIIFYKGKALHMYKCLIVNPLFIPLS